MVCGIGIDIVSIERVRNARFKERFKEYLCVPEEYGDFDEARDPTQFLASLLAVKEAIIKAFPYSLTYHDIRVLKREGQAPYIQFKKAEYNRYTVHVSLSHELAFVVGQALVLEQTP